MRTKYTVSVLDKGSLECVSKGADCYMIFTLAHGEEPDSKLSMKGLRGEMADWIVEIERTLDGILDDDPELEREVEEKYMRRIIGENKNVSV